MRKSNVRKLAPKPLLTGEEVQRISQKLAIALEHNSAEISLVTMLFDHLETVSQHSPTDLEFALYDIKRFLFVGTAESDAAQQEFQSAAFANRGKLLKWPYETEVTK